ncbi:hypothetical protein J2Y66_000258 [Paenarthrobacter nitroguajacolicus]|uniref:hypothetical protein n=1 Tax=Paenarthrobacter TaxID=1742992 RepID=UPI0028562D7C|nr:hypothetical protein [Paenarthrobacter nitroguajacolicus]MDR6985795.1 hypothetical protein [Paenarthrobacter nitroguajacolicus]
MPASHLTSAHLRGPIPDALWQQLGAEFGLPGLEAVRGRLSQLHEDPEPVMQRLVRVFSADGTYCPGFQFREDLSLHPVVLRLFERAMSLGIAHNYFAAWMVTVCPALRDSRPVDQLDRLAPHVLMAALERSFGSGAGERRT